MTSDQKVGGSNPSGCTINNVAARTKAPRTAKSAAFPASRRRANWSNGCAKSVPMNLQMAA